PRRGGEGEGSSATPRALMNEYSYNPDVAVVVDRLRSEDVSRMLVVGADDYELDIECEVRVASPPPGIPLSSGGFVFPAPDGVEAMIVVGGAPPSAPERVSADGSTD